MEEDRMFSISHWGMFEFKQTQELGVIHSRPNKIASQFVGGWPYGRYSKIEDIINKVNTQLGSHWDSKV